MYIGDRTTLLADGFYTAYDYKTALSTIVIEIFRWNEIELIWNKIKKMYLIQTLL